MYGQQIAGRACAIQRATRLFELNSFDPVSRQDRHPHALKFLRHESS
jgi:hypothetical protein